MDSYTNYLYGEMNPSLSIDGDDATNEDATQSYIPSQPYGCPDSNAKKRGKHSAEAEDLLLISAWLNTSIDPIEGNEQRSSTYWSRIGQFFHQYREFDSDRSDNSLMHRWSTIQLAVNKFCGFFEQLRQSGKSEEDKIEDAKEMYMQLEKKKFVFIHCWRELRNHSKWMSVLQSSSNKKSKSHKHSSPSSSSPANTNSVNLEEDNSPGGSFLNLERPMGRNAAKERRKQRQEKVQGDKSSHISKLLEEMKEERSEVNRRRMEFFEKTYIQEEERLTIQRQKLQLEQDRDDMKIMTADTSTMDPVTAQYFNAKKLEILKRMG